MKIYRHKANFAFYIATDEVGLYKGESLVCCIRYSHGIKDWAIDPNIYEQLPTPSIEPSNPLEVLIVTGKSVKSWLKGHAILLASCHRSLI